MKNLQDHEDMRWEPDLPEWETDEDDGDAQPKPIETPKPIEF